MVEDIEYINQILNEANEFHLEAEVVYHALKFMKENPNLGIVEAMTLGMSEWGK